MSPLHDVPLLRSPPFRYADATVSSRMPGMATDRDAGSADHLLAAICEARIGGNFWASSAGAKRRPVLVRARSVADITTLSDAIGQIDRTSVLWILPQTAPKAAAEALVWPAMVLIGDVDPWSVLDSSTRLFAHGDDEWVALAHIAGCPVEILSPGRFGSAQDSAAQRREHILSHLTGTRYRDPFTGKTTGIESTIAQLADWRRAFDVNRDIAAACGIAWWKRREIAHVLGLPEQTPRFFWSERRAIAHAARHSKAVAVWPSRISADMVETARKRNVALVRIEDGFVRSAGLGSNLVPPSSLAIDRLGIHYDPSRPSDLEALLAQAQFPPALLARAQGLRRTIVQGGISKYGGDRDQAFPARQVGRRLVLVPGQVEDDMSVRLGGGGMCSNLELLRRTRALEPDAEIWFRPHPDVDAGHRKGAVPDEDALSQADRVVRGGGMAALLDRVDATHVLTSLTGFEALMRGRDVTCHGTPFYAGWGLTRDLGAVPTRRGRLLTVDQLVAAVLILYPRYLDPVTGLPCPPETLIRRMTDGSATNRLSWITIIRKFQGRMARHLSR
jgi:capsular polysaccharide export protein